MTKHFSLSIAAEAALENVAKRQRSRFVSDAITAHAKKKDIYTYYNTDKSNLELTSSKRKPVSDAKPDSPLEPTQTTATDENDEVCIDKDF
jgi:hypothetical protein